MIRTALRRLAPVALALAATGCAAGTGPGLNDAQQAMAEVKLPGDPAPGGLTVAGIADRTDYRAGEAIVLSVTVSRAASLSVLRVLRNGVTTIVFPSRAQPDPRVAANAPAAVRVIAADRGTELYEFIAALDGAAWPFTRKPAAGADYVELGSTTRALAGDLVATFRHAPRGTVAFGHLALRVSP